MTQKTLAPLVLALVLGALPAYAAHRSEDSASRRDRDREAARIAAEEQHAKIDLLAVRLERATADLQSEAAGRSHGWSWRERRASDALRQLAHRARHFQARVTRHGADSRRAEIAFEDLECAYEVAAARRGDLRRSRNLRDAFAQVDFLMGKLDRRIALLDPVERDKVRYGQRHGESRRAWRRGWRPIVAFHFGF